MERKRKKKRVERSGERWSELERKRKANRKERGERSGINSRNEKKEERSERQKIVERRAMDDIKINM